MNMPFQTFLQRTWKKTMSSIVCGLCNWKTLSHYLDYKTKSAKKKSKRINKISNTMKWYNRPEHRNVYLINALIVFWYIPCLLSVARGFVPVVIKFNRSTSSSSSTKQLQWNESENVRKIKPNNNSYLRLYCSW